MFLKYELDWLSFQVESSAAEYRKYELMQYAWKDLVISCFININESK